ncbi:MAG TPA: glycosyltransferase [Steroidobacter sp.]|uniref:CgeB family protein n=1 Tax=Steroidobacter sp. TaxID=1978227 RepID=UPI002EDB0A4D
MKFVLFYHSLVSDWNHGNAHFLRGVVSELLDRSHTVHVYEPADGWSLGNLRTERGVAIDEFHVAFPELSSRFYELETLDLDAVLEGADVVIVHEWNEPELIARIGEHAARTGCKALFHDTHHRSVTDVESMASLDLRHYHGVLAFGRTVAERYREHGWARETWVWHEAADLRRFHPLPRTECAGDLVWVGNWGDDERGAELVEFLIEPAERLGLNATVHGVRYPQHALHTLRGAGIRHDGWLPNHKVPGVFARYRCTVHVPRQAYVQQLRGIPTIRMFEALSCGIPLISAPWYDDEELFRTGTDYLMAADGRQMQRHLRAVLTDTELSASLVRHGLETIRTRHSCAHRVDELLSIVGTPGARRAHPAKAREALEMSA